MNTPGSDTAYLARRFSHRHLRWHPRTATHQRLGSPRTQHTGGLPCQQPRDRKGGGGSGGGGSRALGARWTAGGREVGGREVDNTASGKCLDEVRWLADYLARPVQHDMVLALQPTSRTHEVLVHLAEAVQELVVHTHARAVVPHVTRVARHHEHRGMFFVAVAELLVLPTDPQ